MLAKIAADIATAGGRAYYVGGYVRDHLMGRPHSQEEDVDVEVIGLDPQTLRSILSRYGDTRLVGKSFPVMLIKGFPLWDFTVPPKPGLSLVEAISRRDFTINAMMIDILSGEIIDYFNGQADLRQGIIRHTTPGVMAEDPLRAYRACQFAARFGFVIHPDTLALISRTDLSQVQPDRIFQELLKLLVLSTQPSVGLGYMLDSGILEKVHPLLFALTTCPQDATRHPEGSVWEHTLLVVDRAADLKSSSSYAEALMLAALLHDLGKPQVTRSGPKGLTTHGHDQKGALLALDFLHGLTRHRRLIESVTSLVREHMQPVLLYKQKDHVGDKALVKLLERVDLRELLLLAEADLLGRGQEQDFLVIRQWLEARISRLGILPGQKLAPLVRGRDLVGAGFKPGPAYSSLLENALDLQLAGKSKTEILEILLKT